MLIRLGYDIRFETPAPTPTIAMLSVHPSRRGDLLQPDVLHLEPEVAATEYLDDFGNICHRLVIPPGPIRFWNNTLIRASDEPDPQNPSARQWPVEELPDEMLKFLLPSRYCEVDLLSYTALQLFGHTQPGWPRVQAICDYVHQRVQFGYHFARNTRTALEGFNECVGVCRDFQHLAITLCRAMNIPARYATGYLGDIRLPPVPSPMDFSAWFEVFLEDRWWTFDARHNTPRFGRVLMATGRDAADVAITTGFGNSILTRFEIISEEVDDVSAQGPGIQQNAAASAA